MRGRKWINAALVGLIAAVVAVPVGVVLADSDQATESKFVDPATAEKIVAEVNAEMDQIAAEDPERAPPDVPPGTYAYIPAEIQPEALADCQRKVEAGEPTDLCELVLKVESGEARSGAYTEQEFDAELPAKAGE